MMANGRQLKQLCLLVMLIIAAPAWLRAEEPASPAVLGERLAEIEAELRDLQQQRDTARQAWESERAQLQTRRGELAQQVLDAALDRQRLDREHARLERELAEARTHRTALKEGRDRLMQRLVGLAERVDLHLAESPDAEAFNAISSDDIAGLTRGPWPDRAALAVRWLERFDELHERAGQVRVVRTSLHTAGGRRETVDLLSVGRIAWAYRTVDDQRMGIALASPAEATGYRWVEALGREHRRALGQVFDAAGAGAGMHHVPMDVTGQVRAELAEQDTGLRATIIAGGPVMIPLGLLALVALALVAERFWFLHRAGHGREQLAHTVVDACRRGDFAAAIKRCQAGDGGVVGRVLLACLNRRTQGQHAMEDSIQEQLLHETPRLERFLAGLAVLGAIAPLLGLLGTVTGIIQTFEVITTFGNVQPGTMAGGISEALITTATGLIVAIPILLLHSLLSGRADRIISDAEKHAATVLNLTHGSAPKPAPAKQPQEASSKS